MKVVLLLHLLQFLIMSFTIRDMENLSGIKAHTIRIWEQRYAVSKPKRTTTNIRYYTNEELKFFLNIALLNKYGVKISRIYKMTEQDIADKVIAFTQPEAKQERLIHELIMEMINLDMVRFESILDNYILTAGIERTILDCVYPFLERIGVLWLTNNINPAQEHLVSNLIRQKILVGMESLKGLPQAKKTICLFLPEGEYHELGLLFMAYLFKSRGNTIVYLGASIPLKDVEFVVSVKKPDYIYTHVTTAGKNFNLDKFISQISARFAGTPVIISGNITNVHEKKIPKKIQFIKSLTAAIKFADTL